MRTAGSAGRGAVAGLALFAVALCVSAFWVDWHDVNEDVHGALFVVVPVLAAAAMLIGAGIGALAAVLVYLHRQS